MDSEASGISSSSAVAVANESLYIYRSLLCANEERARRCQCSINDPQEKRPRRQRPRGNVRSSAASGANRPLYFYHLLIFLLADQRMH
jgi:hypothetical protein